MRWIKALLKELYRGKHPILMKCVIVYSTNTNDLHLELSERYATALIRKLRAARYPHEIFEETDDNWLAFQRYLSEHFENPECIVFFSHGSIDHHGSYDCPIRFTCAQNNHADRCSCAIGDAPIPILSTNTANLLIVDSVHGATACFLGTIFGPISVRGGAECFIGYTDEFQHVRCTFNIPNPFEEIVNSTTMDLLEGMLAEEVRHRTARRYNEWISKSWEREKRPQNWWLIQACLRNNLACLIHH